MRPHQSKGRELQEGGVKLHLDLFSGIGGFALAAKWAGYETVLFCDNDPYCQAVLRKHWPDVPIIGDIRDVNEATVADAKVWSMRNDRQDLGQTDREGDTPNDTSLCRGTQTISGKALSPIDLLTGGFPCQPFSVAGKRGGENDDRYLWSEMLRVISLLKPTWVLAENVSGLTSLDNGLVFERVLSDLESIGYEVQPLVIPACSVNAPHRRDRVWIVAHRDGGRCEGQHLHVQPRGPRQAHTETAGGCEDVPDAEGIGSGTRRAKRPGLGRKSTPDGGSWWSVEPGLGRVAHGVPSRVDRLRCLGNAVVPQVAYEIIRRMEVA